MCDVHGYDAESSFGFGGFIQFGHDEIQTPTALGISVSTFDSIALTGVTVQLPLDFLLGGIGLPSTERRARESNIMGGAESAVFSGLVNSVGQDRFGITPEFAPVVFCDGNQFFSLVETAPTGFLQKGEAVYHR